MEYWLQLKAVAKSSAINWVNIIIDFRVARCSTKWKWKKKKMKTIIFPGLPAVLARANSASGPTLCTLLVLLPTLLLLDPFSPSISFSTISSSVLSLPILFLTSYSTPLHRCALLILCLSCKVFWNSCSTLLRSINSLSHTQIHLKSLLTLPTPSEALLKSSKTINLPQILHTHLSTTQDTPVPIQSWPFSSFSPSPSSSSPLPSTTILPTTKTLPLSTILPSSPSSPVRNVAPLCDTCAGNQQ